LGESKCGSESLEQCFANVSAPGPLLVSKNNHGSSHPCSGKNRLSELFVSKIKNYISEIILDRF